MSSAPPLRPRCRDVVPGGRLGVAACPLALAALFVDAVLMPVAALGLDLVREPVGEVEDLVGGPLGPGRPSPLARACARDGGAPAVDDVPDLVRVPPAVVGVLGPDGLDALLAQDRGSDREPVARAGGRRMSRSA